MFGIFLYLVIQIICLGATIVVFMRRKEKGERSRLRDMPTWKKLTPLVVVPICGFAYASAGGFPFKRDQFLIAIGGTIVGYVVMIVHWIREFRTTNSQNNSGGPEYLYRTNDGTICGPVKQSILLSRYRSGFISEETVVALDATPDNWKPLKDYLELRTITNG